LPRPPWQRAGTPPGHAPSNRRLPKSGPAARSPPGRGRSKASPPRPSSPKPKSPQFEGNPEEVERNQAARREKYAAIRRDADNGLSRRAIISSRHVGRRTVALALASAEPPERKKIHREPAALNGLHTHIDAMIDDNPAIGTAAIWQRLADDHGATVAYYTLRTYVVSRRAAKPPDKID